MPRRIVQSIGANAAARSKHAARVATEAGYTLAMDVLEGFERARDDDLVRANVGEAGRVPQPWKMLEADRVLTWGLRDRDAQVPRRLQVDHKVDLGRLLNRHIGRPRTLANSLHIISSQPELIREIGAVGH